MANNADVIVTVKTGKSTIISSPGGSAMRLVELNDVLAAPRANGDVLTWITANGKFEFHPGTSGTASAPQRWPWKFTGTEISVGFGVVAEQDFIMPSAGALTKWGLLVVNAPGPTTYELRYNPFTVDLLIDTVTIAALQNEIAFERVISQNVIAGDVVAVYETSTISPADHTIKMSGYIEFTP